jgi:hypothetical protein
MEFSMHTVVGIFTIPKALFVTPHECQEVEKLSKYLLLSPTQPYDYSTLTEQV